MKCSACRCTVTRIGARATSAATTTSPVPRATAHGGVGAHGALPRWPGDHRSDRHQQDDVDDSRHGPAPQRHATGRQSRHGLPRQSASTGHAILVRRLDVLRLPEQRQHVAFLVAWNDVRRATLAGQGGRRCRARRFADQPSQRQPVADLVQLAVGNCL